LFSSLRTAFAIVRWGAAAMLVASAFQLTHAPRANQPLIDAVEYAFPSLRTLYFTRAEVATFAHASAYADRYRIEAERLNEKEKRGRTEGVTIDERLSAFVESYEVMRNGEQFVMDEVRGRARERVRWVVSLGLLGIAVLCAPLPWSRLRTRGATRAQP
jgi:zinc/manganese transport system permease protein